MMLDDLRADELRAAHGELAGVLALLGVEVGPEVLHLWLDRAEHGREPVPRDAAEWLEAWAARMRAGIARDGSGRES